MQKKLTMTYTRTSLSQPQYYPTFEQHKDEWDYIREIYPDLELLERTNGPESLEFIIERVGEESRLTEFVGEIINTDGKLHNRIKWCQDNGLTFNYSIGEV